MVESLRSGTGELVRAAMSTPVVCEGLGKGIADARGRPLLDDPVLCAGRIYVRNQPGDLVCLDVSGK